MPDNFKRSARPCDKPRESAWAAMRDTDTVRFLKLMALAGIVFAIYWVWSKTGLILLLWCVCAFLFVATFKASKPVSGALHQIALNSLVGLTVVIGAVVIINLKEPSDPSGLEYVQNLLEQSYFILKNVTDLGLVAGVFLIFILSILQYRLKNRIPLSAYSWVTAMISRVLFVLAVVTTFTVGFYPPCRLNLKKKYHEVAILYHGLAERQWRAQLKEFVCDSAARSRCPADLATNLINDCVISFKFEAMPAQERQLIVRFFAKQFGERAGERLAQQLPTGNKNQNVAELTFPQTIEEWVGQKNELGRQERRAQESERSASGALQILQQVVGAAVPESDSALVSCIVDSLVDGLCESLYNKYGSLPANEYSDLVVSTSKALDGLVPQAHIYTGGLRNSPKLEQMKEAFSREMERENSEIEHQNGELNEHKDVEGPPAEHVFVP